MAKKSDATPARSPSPLSSSSLADTRSIYIRHTLEQFKKMPGDCVGLIYLDPPFNSNRNCEIIWGETKQNRAWEDRHVSMLQ